MQIHKRLFTLLILTSRKTILLIFLSLFGKFHYTILSELFQLHMRHKTYLWQLIPYIKYFRLLQLAIDKIGKLIMQI
jgi:hypothetical protein